MCHFNAPSVIYMAMLPRTMTDPLLKKREERSHVSIGFDHDFKVTQVEEVNRLSLAKKDVGEKSHLTHEENMALVNNIGDEEVVGNVQIPLYNSLNLLDQKLCLAIGRSQGRFYPKPLGLGLASRSRGDQPRFFRGRSDHLLTKVFMNHT